MAENMAIARQRQKAVFFCYRQNTRGTSRRYLIYPEADFEVFRPTGVTLCTDGGEIWHGEGTPCQISPPSVQRLGYKTPKLKFLLRFDQNVEYKRPTTPCAIFIKFAEFVLRFRTRWLLKFSWICSRG